MRRSIHEIGEKAIPGHRDPGCGCCRGGGFRASARVLRVDQGDTS